MILKSKYLQAFVALMTLFAASTGFTEELKIAYVNVQEIMAKAPQALAAVEELKKEFAEKEKKLLAIQSELQTLREKLNRDSLTMKDSEKKELEQNMLRKDRELKWNQGIYDEDLKIMRAELLRAVQTDIYKTIIKIAQEKKYDLVLKEDVFFVSGRVDITSLVLDELKKSPNKK